MVKYIRLLSPDTKTDVWENYFADTIIIKPKSKLYLSSVALDLTANRLYVNQTNNTFIFRNVKGNKGRDITVVLPTGNYNIKTLADQITLSMNKLLEPINSSGSDSVEIGRQWLMTTTSNNKLTLSTKATTKAVSITNTANPKTAIISQSTTGNPTFNYNDPTYVDIWRRTLAPAQGQNTYSAWVISNFDICTCSSNSIQVLNNSTTNAVSQLIYGLVKVNEFDESNVNTTIGTAQLTYCMQIAPVSQGGPLGVFYKNASGNMIQFPNLTPVANDRLIIDISLGNVVYTVKRGSTTQGTANLPFDFNIEYATVVSSNTQNDQFTKYTTWQNPYSITETNDTQVLTLEEQNVGASQSSQCTFDTRTGDFYKLSGFAKGNYTFDKGLDPKALVADFPPNSEMTPASFYISLSNFNGMMESYDSGSYNTIGIQTGRQLPIVAYVPYVVNTNSNNIVYVPPSPVKISLNNVNELNINNFRVELKNEQGNYLAVEDKASVVLVIEDPDE